MVRSRPATAPAGSGPRARGRPRTAHATRAGTGARVPVANARTASPDAVTACTSASGASRSAATYISQPALSATNAISQRRSRSRIRADRNGRRGESRRAPVGPTARRSGAVHLPARRQPASEICHLSPAANTPTSSGGGCCLYLRPSRSGISSQVGPAAVRSARQRELPRDRQPRSVPHWFRRRHPVAPIRTAAPRRTRA